jgi:hypothetical protein
VAKAQGAWNMPLPSISHQKYEDEVRRGDLKAILAMIVVFGCITAVAAVFWLLVIVKL